MAHSTLTIGEVSRRSGVAASALRYYERAGLLAAPARVGGQRRYDASVLEQLATIRVAKEAGFTLAEIAVLLRGETDGWQPMVERKLEDVERMLERARTMKSLLQVAMTCGCTHPLRCDLLNETLRTQVARGQSQR